MLKLRTQIRLLIYLSIASLVLVSAILFIRFQSNNIATSKINSTSTIIEEITSLQLVLNDMKSGQIERIQTQIKVITQRLEEEFAAVESHTPTEKIYLGKISNDFGRFMEIAYEIQQFPDPAEFSGENKTSLAYQQILRVQRDILAHNMINNSFRLQEIELKGLATSLRISNILIILLVGILMAVVIGTANRVNHNFEQAKSNLLAVSENLNSGNIEHQFEFSKQDEFLSVYEAFRLMSDQIQHRITELKAEITERKQVEKSLHDVLQFNEKIILKSPVGLSIYEAESGHCIAANDSIAELIGTTKEQVMLQNFYELESWKKSGLLKTAREVIRKKIKKRKTIEVMTSFRKSLAIDCYFTQFSFGEKQHLFLTVTDVTQRLKDEKTIIRQREKAERYLNLAGVMFIGLDADGNINLANKKACQILKTQQKDILGQNWFENYIPQNIRQTVYAVFQKLIEGNIEPVEYYENIILTKTGKEIQVVWHNTVLKDNDGSIMGVLSSGEDITEKKQLQSKLQQAQKMESIGRLAGGVAHDYNNISSIIIGFSELALENIEHSDPLHDDLIEILTAAKRSTDITRQLLAFARQQTVAPEILDLNDTIGSMLKMLRRLIGEDIDLAWLPGTEVWPIKIDPSQVDQIMANLFVNARDAIANVGKVTVETKNISFDEDYCADHIGFSQGDYVLLVVSDDGNGIAPEILEKIFEPFFTTKGLGNGTGLGLATVYGIVKQNNGFINVYSEQDKGTTIKIYLSRHSGQAVAANHEEILEIPLSYGETILLVEDDSSILKFSKRILEGLGYTVLAATTPNKAVSLAEEHVGEINLLITDVVMPEMNGRELSELLQRAYLNLKILFMSGYTANVIAHRGVLEDGVSFISKPFSKKDMAVKVREVLGGAEDKTHA